jgi:hypothetical protein
MQPKAAGAGGVIQAEGLEEQLVSGLYTLLWVGVIWFLQQAGMRFSERQQAEMERQQALSHNDTQPLYQLPPEIIDHIGLFVDAGSLRSFRDSSLLTHNSLTGGPTGRGVMRRIMENWLNGGGQPESLRGWQLTFSNYHAVMNYLRAQGHDIEGTVRTNWDSHIHHLATNSDSLLGTIGILLTADFNYGAWTRAFWHTMRHTFNNSELARLMTDPGFIEAFAYQLPRTIM